MKKKFFKLMGLALATMLNFSVQAQDEQPGMESLEVKDSYDPLVPQLFAVDHKNNVFAAINVVDNTIDLLHKEQGQFVRDTALLVDVVRKRHDEYRIYRPKSVAIYANYAVFLASNRDSGYLAVVDFSGNVVKKLRFSGAANAFSYSYETQCLYIAGDKPSGYDIVELDAAQGIRNIRLDNAAALHYTKPKKSEEIASKDPWGIGITAVGVSVVFLGLLLLYLVFKNVGRVQIARQKRRHSEETPAIAATNAPGDTSGGVYAAIAAAIHLYNEELHDEETTVLTINKVSRTYSPWSSKIHGMNTYFSRR
jgi:sodium pump decarboxylase gamma subunit